MSSELRATLKRESLLSEQLVGYSVAILVTSASSSFTPNRRPMSSSSALATAATSSPPSPPTSPSPAPSFFWLKLCLFLDFLSVALILPLLPSYFRQAGMTIQQHGYIMSVYHMSQIFGGVFMGILSDLYPKRNILILSFLGSCISYGLVGVTSHLSLLFLSRIIVGIFKQTYTISSSIISSSLTSSTARAEVLSHLNAVRSLSFIVGPSIGSLFYRFHPSAPALLSSLLFLVNMVLCFLTIPLEKRTAVAEAGRGEKDRMTPEANEKQQKSTSSSSSSSSSSSWSSAVVSSLQSMKLLSFLSQNHLFFPLLCPLLLLFLDSITTPAAIPSYLELRYEVEVSSLGYIFSFGSLVAFFCHSFMMKPILSLTSHSIPLSISFTLLLTIFANLFESLYASHIYHYLLFYVPLTTLSISIHHPLAKSYFLHSAPAKYSGTLLGIMNLAENAVSVLAPIYSGTLYSHFGFENRGLIAFFHYAVGSVILWFLLHRHPTATTEVMSDKGTSDPLPGGGDHVKRDVDSGDDSDREAEFEALMAEESTGKDKVD